MNPLEKNRMICFGKGANHAKDAMVARLQIDFANHFADSIDYEPNTMVNNVLQPLIVSKNKSVTNQRKIYAYPGQTFYTGDVVDCYNTKWLVIEVDQNKQVYTSGIMQLCNCELIWQNPDTGEIIRRWVTAEKPYYSNLDESKVLTVSSREFQIQVTYDEETSRINLDKRFMLEIIAGDPCTYKVTSVDSITERFYDNGLVRGFLVLNVTQDLYNPDTDNAELMICDYIAPGEESPDEDLSSDTEISIVYSGKPTIRQGGSAKKFTAQITPENPSSEVQWELTVDPAIADKIVSEISGDTIWLSALDYVELQGQIILLSAICGDKKSQIRVEVVS